MFKKRILAGLMAASLITTIFPANLLAKENTNVTPVETTITKTNVSNPIGGYDTDGNLMYGGDPAVLVDGDTVYLYTGHDTAQSEGYEILEWMCYSTKDLKNWNYEGVIMKADKGSISWANTGKDAWAGQVEKYNGKYYFYYCTWDSTSSGKQSIGVAVSDSATGPFTDIGKPLVKGTVTTPQSSDWNDIDPTVWIETDENGVEHRYLAWGNGKYYICELNEDMISVKDLNGDGKITCGTSAADADIIEKTTGLNIYTEAPWLYRRKDETGKPYGKYYLFYAYGWREQMAYATTDDLLNGTWTFGNVIMPPAATSNTNHMSVFDFKGKTYFVYHNGSLPGGSGFRRNACITELKFEEDGSIATIPETAIGITGDTPYTLCANNGYLISHKNFTNSSVDGDYPYKDVGVGTYLTTKDEDAQWAIIDGKYLPEGTDINKDAYVSIQSENKPGLYLTSNENDSVTLAQDSKYSVSNGTILPNLDTAKAQTFHTVKGLSDDSGISFESVSKPGYYLTLCSGSLVLTDGSDKANATFWLNTTPGASDTPGTGTNTDIATVTMNGQNLAISNNTYSTTVPFDTASVKIQFSLKDADGFAIVDGKKTYSTDTLLIPLTGKDTITTLTVYASDRTTKKDYKIIVSKEAPTDCVPVYNTNLFKTFTFENTNDNAIAVTKSMNPPAVSNPTYKYVDGIKGKAIKLDGTYGLKLCDASGIGSTYTISYWMKPDTIKGSFDPTLAAGTFNPQYWVNLTYPGVIWSNNGNYVDTTTTGKYKENVWQHVALTVNGSQAGTKANTHHAKLYINSELVCEGDIAADIMGKSGAAVYFGVNAWDAYFEGAIDEFAIFSRELSAKEIKSIAYEATDVSAIKNSNDPSIKNDNTNQNVNQNANTVTTTTKKTVKKVVIRQKGKKKNLKKLTVKKKRTKKIKLTAVVTVTGKASKKVTWKSSKKKIATVSSKGVVTIKKKGTVKITATSKANKKKKCTITIKIK